ncbi:MAG: ATP-dependent zinc metalloprotease FtsH [Rickettsiales bacterium]
MKRLGNNGFKNNFLIWAIVILALMMVYQSYFATETANERMAFSDFLSKVESGQVTDVVIRGDSIEGKMSDGSHFATLAPQYPSLIDKLTAQGVKIEVAPLDSAVGSVFGILLSWFPLFLILGVWFYVIKQMQGGGSGKAMGFGKSKAKMISEKNNNVTFKDVAGIDEAREELVEIVDFLKDPQKFQKLGGKIPKGCLLIGSPGTGKTLLARAIAGEAKVPFFSISGSDFVEMFVGVGASRVRDMFDQAKKHAPCIIFIDEIDAVGRHRGAGLGGGNDEREQTLNQMLVEMDGFTASEGVIVIAATNRPDVLDPALLRPGRFDRQITVSLPDINGREQILKVHAAKVKLGPDVDLRVIARGTPGFTGADLANLMNEAALLAARRNKSVITLRDVENAKDKVLMGVERKSMVMTEREKELTAYHEAGHAIICVCLPASDPIHKATIIPRGRALGMVQRLPETDRNSLTLAQLKAIIAVSMGGRVAEEMIFGHENVTTGASGDIKTATSYARNMVTQWGLSDLIGPVLVGDEREEVFLGHSLGHEKRNSEAISSKIDIEIRRLVDEGYDTAKKILTEHLDKLHALAKNLLEFETLTGEEIKGIMDGKAVEREDESIINKLDTPSVPSSGKKKKKLSETEGEQEA